ncbi:TonB-dependent receptor plug domain-containing protein [Spirochaetota bacterium]
MNRKSILICISFIFVLYMFADTEEAEKYDLGEILVTPTKTTVRESEIGMDVSVITGEEIKKSGKHSAIEVLRSVPGIVISQGSAFGGRASLYMRGAKPGHTLVLINGIEANDPISADRSFNLAHMSTADIERIEIIRGPQSTMYGSDAISGIINIITRTGMGKPSVNISLEGGSHRTFTEHVQIGGSMELFSYNFSLFRMDTGGISRAAKREGLDTDMDLDGYNNTSVSGKLCYRLLPDGVFNLYFKYITANIELDNGAYSDDPNYTGKSRSLNSKLEYTQPFFPWWDHRVNMTYTRIDRSNSDPKDDIDTDDCLEDWYKADAMKTEWQHNFSIAEINVFTMGFEYELERGSSYYDDGTWISDFEEKKVYNAAAYAQDQLELFNALFMTAGMRIDLHEIFGNVFNYRTSIAYRVPVLNTLLKGNYGTGFKAPSLYQLYSVYGSTELGPEKNICFDIGAEQTFFKKKIKVDALFFNNKFTDMIEWEADTWQYKNIARAFTKGVEAEIVFAPTEVFSLSMNYTYTEAVDNDTGEALLRRPMHQGSGGIDIFLFNKLTVNTTLLYTGERDDMNYTVSPSKRVVLADYLTADLAISYKLFDHLTLKGRIENMLNVEYQDVYGFETPGISFYGGIDLSL